MFKGWFPCLPTTQGNGFLFLAIPTSTKEVRAPAATPLAVHLVMSSIAGPEFKGKNTTRTLKLTLQMVFFRKIQGWTSMSHNQNLVLKWSTQGHVRNLKRCLHPCGSNGQNPPSNKARSNRGSALKQKLRLETFRGISTKP